MSDARQRERWLQDVENHQRNLVFPDTVQNEARFWRNLANTPWKASTKLGMAVLAIFVATGIGMFVVAAIQGHIVWAVALGMILLWGPIFGAIAWATRRNLRKIEEARRGPRTPHH